MRFHSLDATFGKLKNRFALHASDLYLKHPGTGERLEFHAPLPPELARLLEDI